MAKITIQDGILRKKSGFFLWKKIAEIDLSEVEIFVPRVGLYPKRYVFIGSADGEIHKMRLGRNLTKQVLDELKNHNAPIFDHLDSTLDPDGVCEGFNDGNCGLMNANNVWMTSENIVYIPKRKFLMPDSEPICMSIADVLFSSTSPNTMLGFLPKGHATYFGGESDQAIFKHPNINYAIRLEEHLKNNGSKIGQEANEVFKSGGFSLFYLFSPSKWGVKETIGFTDDGIVYEREKGKKRERLFLPYEELYYAEAKTSFLGFNYISICGQQNIFTKRRFSNKAIKLIKETLDAHNVQEPKQELRPTWIFGLFEYPFSKRKLAIFSDRFLYTDSLTKEVISFDGYAVENLAWKKKHWFYFVGYLFFEVKWSNIRKDQQSQGPQTVKFAMPKLWFCQKNRIREMVSGDYNDEDFRKECSIKKVIYR